MDVSVSVLVIVRITRTRRKFENKNKNEKEMRTNWDKKENKEHEELVERYKKLIQLFLCQS
jgi:hypothetical protein